MAEIVSKAQAFTGRRPRLVEVVMAAIAGAVIVLAIAWAVFVSSAPSVAAPSRSATQYLQEPGLLDQRQGEQGGVDAAAPGGTLVDPALQEHRRGERQGN